MGPIDFCNEILFTMFSVGILQGPGVGCCEKYQKVPITRASCMCDFEASAQSINFPTVLPHALCYLLEGDIKRNLKDRVANENTST